MSSTISKTEKGTYSSQRMLIIPKNTIRLEQHLFSDDNTLYNGFNNKYEPLFLSTDAINATNFHTLWLWLLYNIQARQKTMISTKQQKQLYSSYASSNMPSFPDKILNKRVYVGWQPLTALSSERLTSHYRKLMLNTTGLFTIISVTYRTMWQYTRIVSQTLSLLKIGKPIKPVSTFDGFSGNNISTTPHESNNRTSLFNKP